MPGALFGNPAFSQISDFWRPHSLFACLCAEARRNLTKAVPGSTDGFGQFCGQVHKFLSDKRIQGLLDSSHLLLSEHFAQQGIQCDSLNCVDLHLVHWSKFQAQCSPSVVLSFFYSASLLCSPVPLWLLLKVGISDLRGQSSALKWQLSHISDTYIVRISGRIRTFPYTCTLLSSFIRVFVQYFSIQPGGTSMFYWTEIFFGTYFCRPLYL